MSAIAFIRFLLMFLMVNVFASISTFSDQITLVLPLYLDDFSRSLILFESLRTFVDKSLVHKMIVIVPANQLHIFNSIFDSYRSTLPFKIEVQSESELIDAFIIQHSYSYGLQMALKLLVAEWISTEFYMTLDADIILLQPLSSSKLFCKNKSIFEFESRILHHSNWWQGSEYLLGLTSTSSYHSISMEDQGFNVTPLLLNTQGSLFTLKLLESSLLNRQSSLYSKSDYMNNVYDQCYQNINSLNTYNAISDYHEDEENDDTNTCNSTIKSVDIENKHNNYNNNNNEKMRMLKKHQHRRSTTTNSTSLTNCIWLISFGHEGMIFSEYTLYRLALNSLDLFDYYHIRDDRVHLHSLIKNDDDYEEEEDTNRSDMSRNSSSSSNSDRSIRSNNNNSSSETKHYRMHCNDVWFKHELPWRYSNKTTATIIPASSSSVSTSTDNHHHHQEYECLFSVVQSSTGVSPSAVLKEFQTGSWSSSNNNNS